MGTATTSLPGMLVDRGVNAALAESIVREGDPAAIVRTVEWFDQQNGRIGPGVLVAELKAGGRKAKPKSMAEQQAEYGESIVEWLRKNFPEWNRDDGNRTHSAAIACVIRLHHAHGKGNVSKAKHGQEIRAAVKAWEARFAD